MSYLEQKEFETKILHLLRTQPTVRAIGEDILDLAEKFKWLDNVKIGNQQVFAEKPEFRKTNDFKSF